MRTGVVMWMRRLRREPAPIALVAISLGLPLGAGIMALSLNAAMFWRPLPFVDADQLVKIEPRTAAAEPRWVSLPELNALATGAAAPFQASTGYTVADVIVAAAPPLGAEGLLGTLVSATFLDLFGIKTQLGTLPDASAYSSSGERVVLLGHELWQRRFAGDPAIIGRTIDLSTNDYFRGATGTYRVIGVLPRDLWLFWKRIDLVMPLRLDAAQSGDPNSPVVEHVIARLHRDWSVSAAQATAGALLAQVRSAGAVDGVHSLSVDSLQRAHYRPQERQLQTILVIALIVVVLAAANVMVAALTTALARRREIAVRVALGCEPRRLWWDTMVETSATVSCAVVLGVVAGSWLTSMIAAAAPDRWLDRVPGGVNAFRLDANIGIAIGAVSIAVVLLSSVVVQRVNRSGSLWQVISTSRLLASPRSRRARWGLLGVEIALAVTALAVGFVLTTQLYRLRTTDMGVDAERTIAAWINTEAAVLQTANDRAAYFDRLLTAVRAQPGIEAAGAVDLPFHYDWQSVVVRTEGGNQTPSSRALGRAATPGYLEASGIRLRGGRWFDDRDRSGAAPVVVVSDALAAALWPAGDALGQSIVLGAQPAASSEPAASSVTIIGVVSNTRHAPHLPEDRVVYRALAQAPPASIYITAKGRAGVEPGPLVIVAVGSINANQPVGGPWPIRQWISDRTADLQFLVLFVTLVAAVGALIAVVGVYAVTSHFVAESAHDIAIRRAIGASHLQILRWFGWRCAAILLAGLTGGLLLTMSAFRLLIANITGVRQPTLIELVVIGAAAVACMMLGMAAPVRRALGVNATLASGTSTYASE
jgi:predicted permease